MDRTIFVDVDGVVADSVTWWLKLYNREWDDHLKKQDIHTYSIHLYTKCTLEEFERYFSNYNGVLPEPRAVEVLKRMTETWRVVYATSGHQNNLAWLQRYGLAQDQQNYVRLQDKSLLRGHALIDDKPSNLMRFTGRKFIFRQPWNEGEWDWDSLEKTLCERR